AFPGSQNSAGQPRPLRRQPVRHAGSSSAAAEMGRGRTGDRGDGGPGIELRGHGRQHPHRRIAGPHHHPYPGTGCAVDPDDPANFRGTHDAVHVVRGVRAGAGAGGGTWPDLTAGMRGAYNTPYHGSGPCLSPHPAPGCAVDPEKCTKAMTKDTGCRSERPREGNRRLKVPSASPAADPFAAAAWNAAWAASICCRVIPLKMARGFRRPRRGRKRVEPRTRVVPWDGAFFHFFRSFCTGGVCMSTINITLPDGAVRKVEAGTTL